MRGISGILDVEQVLQLIVDKVRDLVAAQYAALGIVDENGRSVAETLDIVERTLDIDRNDHKSEYAD